MKTYRRWPLIDRLNRMVERDENTGCWNFVGAKNELGYGVIGSGGKGGRMLGAHRAMWEHLVGPIPPGNHLHHICKNPSCCRPSHLMSVSPYEHKIVEPNSHRNKTHCVHGHPFSGDNLRVVIRNGHEHRECRACCNQRVKNAYRRSHPLPSKPRPLKTHCKFGHPLSGDNLSRAGLKRGERVCKLCAAARQREQRLRDVDAYREYQRDYKRMHRSKDSDATPRPDG